MQKYEDSALLAVCPRLAISVNHLSGCLLRYLVSNSSNLVYMTQIQQDCLRTSGVCLEATIVLSHNEVTNEVSIRL